MRRLHLFAKSENKLVDYVGFFLLGALSLGYVILSCNYFAQLHFRIPFLKIPFFIGDIVFAICFCLFFGKWLKSQKSMNIVECVFLLYLGFVIVKTINGYFIWGPLSLRHATLFLYPLFAVFSYSFYRNDFFDNRKKLFFILAFLLIIYTSTFTSFYIYYALPCLFLAAALISTYPKKAMRYSFYLLLFLVFPYKFVFKDSRTFIIANLFAIAYVIFGLLCFIRIKNIFKILSFSLILFFAIIFLMPYFRGSRTIKSLSDIERTINIYNKFTKLVRLAEPSYLKKDLPVRLYNDRVYEPHDEKYYFQPYMLINWKELDNAFFGLPKTVKKWLPQKKKSDVDVVKIEEAREIKKTDVAAKVVKFQNADKNLLKLLRETSDIDNLKPDEEPPISNTIFRIFIWGDAFEELSSGRPIFGFDFGKPFRSRRVEIAHMAEGEWSRDGWISFHNSYIDIVYRAGIPGILMVIAVFTITIFIVLTSFRKQSLTGLLLTGILISWLISANFMEALEMPYNAIPMWSLFGLTCAYLFKNKKI